MKQALFFITVLIAAPVLSQQTEKNEDVIPEKVEEIVLDVNAPPFTESGCFSIRGIHNFSSLHDLSLIHI